MAGWTGLEPDMAHFKKPMQDAEMPLKSLRHKGFSV